MRYIPHTETEVREMLAAIGVQSLDDLFEPVPVGDAWARSDIGRFCSELSGPRKYPLGDLGGLAAKHPAVA